MKRKLIVQLRGNLGNQLYQYIAALELVNGDANEVLIDTRLCKDYGAYSLPVVIAPDYLRLATPFNLAIVGEIPVRSIGFRTISKFQKRLFDPCFRYKGECGWYGRYADANQRRLDGKPVSFVCGMFQDHAYYRNALQYISQYAKASNNEDRYDLAISLRQGDDYKNFGIRLGKTYYHNALQMIRWETVRRVAITGDTLPPWNLYSVVPKGIAVDSFIGQDLESQFSVLRNARAHVMANSTFSWWATVFGLSNNPNIECYACANWFTPDQVSFVNASCISSE